MSISVDRHSMTWQFIGTSEAVAAINESVQKIAGFQVPVLILGETGTGKEVVAKTIHAQSGLPKERFVAINCGAYPDSLVINELFGHEKGAFTGAVGRQLGVVKQAEGGTLFLDEIDSLSPAAQVVLLRFLQEKEYRPLGSAHLHHANVRVIAATNANIDHMVDQCLFRRDLLYRLDVMRLVLPPLRERLDDILLLAEFFIEKYAEQYRLEVPSLSEGEREILLGYQWPGNVRELENHIQRFLLLGKLQLPDASVSLPEASPADTVVENETHQTLVSSIEQPIMVLEENTLSLSDKDMQNAKAEVIENFERHYLTRLMAEADGNVTLAAKIAGKERRCLGKLLKKHAIDRHPCCK